MARDGSGTFNYTATSVAPAASGTTIESGDFNTTMTEIKDALTQSLSKDGQTVITGTIDFDGNALIFDTDGDFTAQANNDDQLDITGGAINEAKGADIASATTTDIGASNGNFVDITGTTTITGLGTVQAGTRRIVQFDGALTLTYNATSLILPGNVNILVKAGDIAEFVSLGGGNWVCVNYQKDLVKPDKLIFHVNIASSQSNITGVDVVEFSNSVFDTSSDFDTITNYRYTPSVAGKYFFTSTINWASVASGDNLFLYIYKNGSPSAAIEMIADTASQQGMNISTILDMNGTTDYVDVRAENKGRDTSALAGPGSLLFFTGYMVD